MIRAKSVVFAFIFVMMGYVLYHNERFLIQPSNPAWGHYGPIGWPLVLHGIAGACALFLAPLQFSDRLRRKYTRLHRMTGRIYVVGALVLAPIGAYIQYWEETLGEPRSFTIATVVDAGLLFTTTAIAFLFAVRRNIPLHRQWMTRSYAVALAFFEIRFITGVTGWEAGGSRAIETAVWACVALSLLLADIANNWTELGRAVRSPAVSRQTIAGPAAETA